MLQLYLQILTYLPLHIALKFTTNLKHLSPDMSPYINVFYQHYPVKVVIDSGAETNMIRESVARQIGIPISSSSQLALQADGHSSLEVVGETCITLTCDKHSFLLEALVVSNLDSGILAGVPIHGPE